MEGIINKLDIRNTKYVRNKKYTTREYITGIIEVLSNNTSWRKYNGKISGRILNNKHNYYVRLGVYDELYKSTLELYTRIKEEPIKVISIDSTFIANKNGTEKIARNIFYKNKRGRKISVAVDESGVPLTVHLSKGNKHDARIAPKIINKLLINKTSEEKLILADKAYDSKKIRQLIRSKNYNPIISKRRYRNSKKRTIKKKYRKIYKKRIIVENFFAWLKAFSIIDKIYEKTTKSYLGLLYLAISIIIYRKIN